MSDALTSLFAKHLTRMARFGYFSITRSEIDKIGIVVSAEQDTAITVIANRAKLVPVFGTLVIGLFKDERIKKTDWDEINRLRQSAKGRKQLREGTAFKEPFKRNVRARN